MKADIPRNYPARATEWAIYYEWSDEWHSGKGVAREWAIDPAVALRRMLKRLGNQNLPLRKIKIMWSQENEDRHRAH